MHYTTVTPNDTNYALSACSYTKLGDLATGSNSVLLSNHVIYQFLMNCLVGCVQSIVYLYIARSLVGGALTA